MQFIPVLILLIAGAFAAPLNIEDVEDSFNLPAETEAPAIENEAPKEEVVEPATEPNVEIPQEPETPEPEKPVEETPEQPAEETTAEVTEKPDEETPKKPETEAETEAPEVFEAETEVPSSQEETPVAAEAPAAEPTETESEAKAEDADDEDSDSDEDEETKPAETEEPTNTDSEKANEEEEEEEEEEDKPATAEETTMEPVVATQHRTGAIATVDGITIKFALQAIWKVNGESRRGYVVKVTNGSEKDVCGITFSNDAKTTDIWNISLNEDGSFTTKDLHLAPGATANQFGYVSHGRSTPTILAVTYC